MCEERVVVDTCVVIDFCGRTDDLCVLPVLTVAGDRSPSTVDWDSDKGIELATRNP